MPQKIWISYQERKTFVKNLCQEVSTNHASTILIVRMDLNVPRLLSQTTLQYKYACMFSLKRMNAVEKFFGMATHKFVMLVLNVARKLSTIIVIAIVFIDNIE